MFLFNYIFNDLAQYIFFVDEVIKDVFTFLNIFQIEFI